MELRSETLVRRQRSGRGPSKGVDGEPRSRSAAAAGLNASDRELFERLRAWRAETARAASIPAFIVFPDTTLTGIAQARPSTLAELMAVSGVGAKKLEQFGEDVLSVVAAAVPPVEPPRVDVDPDPPRGRRFHEGETLA